MFIATKTATQITVFNIFRNYARFTKKIQDPGIRRRKGILGVDQNEDAVDFEDIESDFMEVHKSHKEFVREIESNKEREKYLIVKEKYFKEKYPNFLTWHDKEQIRYLHKTDPEEWTIERLSEGFPALPDVIKKIIKSNWTKTKQNKISNHDTSVQKNWELYKKGKMKDLPIELQTHLSKFTNRALSFQPFVAPETNKDIINIKKQKVNTEFSDIIKSYDKFKNNVSEPLNTNNLLKPPKNEINKIYTKKQVTLKELQVDLKNKIQKGKPVDEVAPCIVKNLEATNKIEQSTKELIDLSKSKYHTSTGIQHLEKKPKDLSHLNYPERITITKEIFKKGFIYKLNDCYYDDDGEFLYRVPGMY